MLNVFVSFHKDKGASEAELIQKEIEKAFPLASVFVSVDPNSKMMGADWDRQIYANLHYANVFVAIIDDAWANRIHKPDSIVRREVEAALWNPGIQAHFPYRLDNVKVPSPDDMPPSVRDFLRKEFCQGDVNLPTQRDQLIKDLRQIEATLAITNKLPLVFISSALALRTSNDSLAFFSLVVTEIVHQARRETRLPMSVIVKIPEMETVEAAVVEQKRILADVLEHHDLYRAIILAPFQVKALQPYVMAFLKQHPKYPIFTVDQCFDPDGWKIVPATSFVSSVADASLVVAETPPVTPEEVAVSPTTSVADVSTPAEASVPVPLGVMSNWKEGGKLAGKLIQNYLETVKVETPTVWVLIGTSGTEGRQDGFAEWLVDSKKYKVKRASLDTTKSTDGSSGDANLKVITIVEIDGRFQQDYAKNQVKGKYDAEKVLPHAIFCTNDEMSLGVCDALDEIDEEAQTVKPTASSEPTGSEADNLRPKDAAGSAPTFGIKIVGFDAIHDFTTHISPKEDPTRSHPRFLNTIDVRIREQVRQLMDMIVEYVRNPAVRPEAFMKVMPGEFIPIKTQKARVKREMKKWTKAHSSELTAYQKERTAPPTTATSTTSS